jgi:hypothetical protein
VAISGTTKEVEELLRKLHAVTVESSGSVNKYVTKDNQIRVAK